MYANAIRPDLPVLLLHNLDHTWTPAEIDEAQREVAKMEAAIRGEGHPVANVPVFDAGLTQHLHGYDPEEYVVLNVCEGVPGIPHSDALVARALEVLGFAYTGSTPEVLDLSWNKHLVKARLDRHRVPTPRWRVCDSPCVDGWDRFPAIVKPVREHASVGVTTEAVVLTRGELRQRITYVLDELRQPALVEDFVDGRELHVSLVGDGTVEMLPPAEMDFSAFGDVRERLCTFDSKFTPGSRHYEQIRLRLPAELGEAERRQLEQVALAAYHAVGCRDYARLDIRLRDGTFYVLDVNPNCDITSDTSTAAAAEAAGYSYGQMISLLVNLAARRHPVYGAGRH